MLELVKFMEIRKNLEKHHAVFSMLWELGKPTFTNLIDTAAVGFNTKGHHIEFLFNSDYWNKISDYQKEFVICHECLHILLNHGIRAKDVTKQDADAANIAMDIVVNSMLIGKFGFERKNLSKDLCWIDVVFPQENVPLNLCFEHYYELLKNRKVNCKLILDNHDGLGTVELDDIENSLNGNLSHQEKDTLNDMIGKHSQAGSQPGKQWLTVDTEPVVKKKKWETVIKKWSHRFLNENHSDLEQWARINRRLESFKTDLMLPSEMEIEHTAEDNKKILVYFFQDTSGSCYKLRDRFFKAAKSLPSNRLDIKMFCFDTKVYSTSLESGKLFGFGGTRFDCIESYIQRNKELMKESYPQAVFVASDGFSESSVYPEKPMRWYFFLSSPYRKYIPQKSNVFNLSEFE